MTTKHNKIAKFNFIIVLFGAFLVISLSTVISRVNFSKEEAKAQTSAFVSFPGDYGEHPTFLSEWWYLNLFAKTTKTDGTDEKDLGYVISLSRINGNKGLLSSRYDAKSKSFRESTNTGGSLSVSLVGGKYLLAKYVNGLTTTTLEEKVPSSDRKRWYKLIGKTTEMGSFDITLKERTTTFSGYTSPLLWGGTTGNCRGKISVFGPDDTFYYSIPDLDITGTITDIDGVIRNIKGGKTWFDHQWFNSTPPGSWKGHYWTSFHFTNSSNLYVRGPHQAVGFVTQIYSDGPKYTYWVKRNADGTNGCGTDGTIAVKNYGSTNYPNSWNLNNKLFVANGYSLSDNQIFKPPIGPTFFEPLSSYSGTVNGRSFTGLGFFETHLKRDLVATPTPTSVPTSCNSNINPGPSGGKCTNIISDKYIASWSVPSGTFDKQVLRVSTSQACVLAGCPVGCNCVVKADLNKYTSSYSINALSPSTTYWSRIAAVCTNPDGSIGWKDNTWSCTTPGYKLINMSYCKKTTTASWVCTQTSSQYPNTSAGISQCQTNLGIYLQGQTTGKCYGDPSDCLCP